MFETAHLHAAIEQLNQHIAELQTKAQSLVDHGRANAKKLPDFYAPTTTATQERLAGLLASVPVANRVTWEHEAWANWDVEPMTSKLDLLRYGDLAELRSNGAFTAPAYLPFIGRNNTIVIQGNGKTAPACEALLQSLLVRTALMLPHQASYTLLDPSGNGTAFPMRKFLPQVSLNSDDMRRDLDRVIADIRRIIETYLDASITSFERIPDDIRVNERFHFVFAADFPHKYERRAIEALYSIGTTGPRAGTYLFIHHNQDHELPRDMGIDALKNAFYVTVAPTTLNLNGKLDFKLTPDMAPPSGVQEQVFAKLSAAKPMERRLLWDEVVGLPPDQWWTGDAATTIESPIGTRGGSEFLKVWFGEDREGRQCAHGMLGAMTGSGKSTLYHTLITGLVTRYSPEELRIYLIDGKFGVEFQPYLHLPHAEVVSLKTSAELSRSVLAELTAEMSRRNAMFGRSGVANLSAYRLKGQPEGKLPRILLVVDEYQQLFEGDREGVASNLLRQLSEQGRSAGIYMFLASQRFGAAGMLYQTSIFNNIHLRMAMQMPESEIRSLTEFGARGKGLILATCNLPGKVVLNDRAGDDSANVAGKGAVLAPQRHAEILQQLQTKAQTLPPSSLPQRVVFTGDAQPQLINNPYVASLIQQSSWMTPPALETFARTPASAGGLGIADWFAPELPAAVWLGQEFNVRGQALLILRRRTAEHAMLIGSNNPVRYGMLAAMLVSLALNAGPQQQRFIVVDRSIAGSQWSTALQLVCEQVLRPAGFALTFAQDDGAVETVLNHLITELDHRRTLAEAERVGQQSIIVMMTELDRIELLRRRPDAYGMSESPAGELLRRVCVEGPSVGIHLLLSFTGVRPMANIIDERRGLVHFRHRVALQMSEDDSHTLVRSWRANQLQADGPTPVSALYIDIESDKAVRFKPYSIEDSGLPGGQAFGAQLETIGQALATRQHRGQWAAAQPAD